MNLWNDLRYAARQLRQSPGFTLTVLLTLALCIGANTAIFSVVDAVFFRPLPFHQPDRLVMVVREARQGGATSRNTGQTGRAWELIRDHATLLEPAVTSRGHNGVNLVAAGHAEFIQQQRMGAGLFHVLGTSPLAGREFTRQEDIPNGPNLTILSYALWHRLFQADPAILGRTIQLRGAPYTVIGVMPENFRANGEADLWTPLQASQSNEGGGMNFEIVGRLRPGVTEAQATGQLTAITKPMIDEMKLPPGITLIQRAIPLQQGLSTDLRPKLVLLWAAVALVLLIGCVNIAGILLSRSALRSREIATRLALGAGRRRIVAQLLAESTLLALLGGALGMLLGQFALQALLALNPKEFSSVSAIHLDLRILSIMLALSLLTSLLFGLLPAWQATKIDLRAALNEAGRGASRASQTWRQLLVFAEIALGVILVVAAGLLIHTFTKLAGQKPGFNSEHVTAASLSLQDARYTTPSAATHLFQASLDRIQNIPGVESAAVALSLPYQRPLNMYVQAVSGEDLSHRDPITNMTYVTPGFFHVLQIPLLQGRLLAPSDIATSAPVAVVNQAFLRRYFHHNPQALGAQVKVGDTAFQIVGIVGDVPEQNGWGPYMGPVDAFAEVYVTPDQFPAASFAMVNTFLTPNWIVRTHGTVGRLPYAMQHSLQSVDPTLPFSSFHTMDELRSTSFLDQRYHALLFSTLAGLALLLATLGVYGLVAQSVTQRTREMSIRLALGAGLPNILQTAIRPSLTLAFAGILTGLVLSLFAARLLQSLIWGISTTDPATLLGVAVLLLLVTFLASLIPALRLLRLDPAQTLRHD